MKQLSHIDSIFFYNETPSTPLHISPILIYDTSSADGGVVRFKDILQRFDERIHKSPVFRQRLVKVPFNLDAPYWIEDEEFDLEFHVRHLSLPKPGDWRQFCILLARLHSRPLDLNRPPWEAYIIEGLDNITGMPPGAFAMYMKIHHCAIDGATGNQIIEALHDLEPNPRPVSYPDHWQGETPPGQLALLKNAYFNALKSPRQAVKVAKHAYKSHVEGKKGFHGKAFENHEVKDRIRFNEAVTPHRVFGGYRMALDELKYIKNQVGDCTLNDVLLSIVGGSMRRYLQTKGELPEHSLVAGVPISTRDVKDVNSEGGNQVAGMRLHLRTDIKDPVERLKLIHQDAIGSKAYANAIGVERMSTILNSIPSGLASLGMRAAASTHLAARSPLLHTIVTNVPGPQFPMYMTGARAALWLGAGCPLDGTGLFHTINSYYGSVCLTFICCRKMMPDPDFYHQCITSSFQELMKAAQKLQAKRYSADSKLKTTIHQASAEATNKARPKRKPRAKKALQLDSENSQVKKMQTVSEQGRMNR